jgi:hypothetical protein
LLTRVETSPEFRKSASGLTVVEEVVVGGGGRRRRGVGHRGDRDGLPVLSRQHRSLVVQEVEVRDTHRVVDVGPDDRQGSLLLHVWKILMISAA